jgi:hypothetical protein
VQFLTSLSPSPTVKPAFFRIPPKANALIGFCGEWLGIWCHSTLKFFVLVAHPLAVGSFIFAANSTGQGQDANAFTLTPYSQLQDYELSYII